MKSVYILLCRTNTIFSGLIHMATGNKYTHAALSLDREMTRLYSFGRQNLYFPMIAGFVPEDIKMGVYRKNGGAPCAVYELRVSDKVYDTIESRINWFIAHKDYYRYNFLGILFYMLDIPFYRRKHYMCSQFVAEVLGSAGALKCPKEQSLMKPVDFEGLKELNLVYCGDLRGCVSSSDQALYPQGKLRTV